MARGRKKTPTAILEKRGSWRAKTRQHEPIYDPVKSDMAIPSILKAEGKKIWKDIFPRLANMGVLTDVDLAAFTRYCFYWQRWKEALKKPETKISDLVKLENIILKLEQQFGLTPVSRPNITSNQVDNEDKDQKKHDYFKSSIRIY